MPKGKPVGFGRGFLCGKGGCFLFCYTITDQQLISLENKILQMKTVSRSPDKISSKPLSSQSVQ